MQGGFSIREYTSRMRSVNVLNCWPFDETFGEETVKSLLPPIVVKRFTWWLDELPLLHSESAEELETSETKTKKVLEKGETSSRNVDRHLEGAEEGVKVVKYKGKMRATKKRSIVEIFAVAPPVKRAIGGEVETEELEEEEEDKSCNSNPRNVGISRTRKNKNRNKKMKNTDVILRKAMRVVKKIKRKKAAEERGGSKEIDVPDKESCFKLKPHAQEKASGNSSSSCSKGSDNDIHDCVSIPKRKPKLPDLGPYKKFVACEAFKLIGEHHPELPVRGILKNQNKEFFLKKSQKCLLQKAVQLNGCSSQKANKHVTFSENDKILRLSQKPSQSAEYLKLRKDCGFGSGSIDRAVAVGKDSTSSESSGGEGASTRVGKEIGAGLASNKQLEMFHVDSTTLGKRNYEWEHCTRSGSSERSAMYRVNQHWFDHDLREAPHNTMDVCSEFYHMPRDRYYNSQNVKLITTSSNTTCRRPSNEDIGTPPPIFPPLCFEDYLRAHNDASMSHPSNMKRTYKLTEASSENTAINCAHSIHFQTFPHLSPNELLHSFCSLPDGSKAEDIRGRSTNRTCEKFVGLPLNSQGELITMNSSAKRDVNLMLSSNVSAAHCIDLSLPSNALTKCLGHHSEHRNLGSRTSSRGQLNLFPVESHVKENAAPVIPSRLGIIESRSVKANLDFDFPDVNYHPFHNSEKTACQGNNRVQMGPEKAKCQSKMRLMGKEFEVGGRGVQGFEDGRMWKDKKIIDELHFQSEPSFRDLRETLFFPSEITVNHRSQSKYDLPYFDCQTSSTYKSVFLTRTVDCAQNCHPSLPPDTYSEIYNSKSLFSEPFTTGHNSQLFSLELPKASAPHQELCSNMSPSVNQLKSKQNLHYSSLSTIKFPFMHPDLDGHANSSWAPRSSLIQQPLCFDVSEKASRLSNIQSCTLGCSHPYPESGTIHGMNSSVSFRPDDFYMFRSGSALQSIAPAAFTPLPYYPGVLPVSAMQRNHGNQNKIKERIKSRIGIRDLNICKRSKGAPSALSNAHFKPLKRSTLGFHEGLQCAVRKPAACVSFEDSVRNMEDAFVSCTAAKSSRFVMSGDYDQTKKDGQTQTISPFADSYIETARTGPIKLTAGSKHILKACQQKDQDTSLSATNLGFRFS